MVRSKQGSATGYNEEGFRAYLESVSDTAFDGFTWQAVEAAVAADGHGALVRSIAAGVSLAVLDHPVLVVDS
jgi:hypothetical protein